MQHFFYFFIISRVFTAPRNDNTAALFYIIFEMTELLESAELERLQDGRLSPAWPKGLPVLLIKKGGTVFALENRCAHMGCPLAAGTLDGYTLRCPCHDWRFDVRDGAFLDAPALRLKTYPVTIQNGKVFIEAEK
jgi:3-phenylpropionate/trans-cinnamate dioxygenase ferredoxin subunit